MFKLLLCNRKKKGLGYGKFHNHWKNQRAGLVLELQSQLGYTQYAQLHQACRINLLYQAIRISRSPLVTDLVAAFQSKKAPKSKSDPQTQREESWDVVDEFLYPSKEALSEALSSEAGVAAAQRLVDDRTPWVRRSAVVTTEEFVVIEDPSSRSPKINTVFFVRSPPGMTPEEMLAYWGVDHKKLFVSLQRVLHYQGYNQLFVRSAPELSAVVETLGGSAGEEYNGVAVVINDSQWKIAWAAVSPRSELANLTLIKDENYFIDSRRSELVYGRRYVIGPEARATTIA